MELGFVVSQAWLHCFLVHSSTLLFIQECCEWSFWAWSRVDKYRRWGKTPSPASRSSQAFLGEKASTRNIWSIARAKAVEATENFQGWKEESCWRVAGALSAYFKICPSFWTCLKTSSTLKPPELLHSHGCLPFLGSDSVSVLVHYLAWLSAWVFSCIPHVDHGRAHCYSYFLSTSSSTFQNSLWNGITWGTC